MDQGHVILVVGDESREREALFDLLKSEGYHVHAVATCEQALDAARRHKPAVALIDLWLADLPGHVVLHGLRQAMPDMECIALLTSPAQQEGAYEALKLGAFTFLRRSYDARQLLVTVERAIEKRQNAKALLDVKERLAVMFDSLPAGILIVDERTRAVVDANPAAVRQIGAPKAEIIGSLMHARALGAGGAAESPAPATSGVTPEGVATRQTGRRIPATRTVATITLGGRRHLVESFLDVSGRLEVEDRLAVASTLSDLLLDGVQDLVMTVNASGTVLKVHGGAPRDQGEILEDRESAALLPAICRDRYRRTLRDLFHDGRGTAFSAGTPPFEFWSIRMDPVLSRGETVAAAVRVRNLAALDRAAALMRFRGAAVDLGGEALLVVDTEGTIVDANTAACHLLEYESAELIGLAFKQVDQPPEPRPWSRMWPALVAQGPQACESVHQTRGGTSLPVRLTLHHVLIEGTALALVFVRDLSAIQRLDAAHQDLASREAGLLSAVHDPMWLLDRQHTIRDLNEAAAATAGKAVSALREQPYDRAVAPALARGRLERIENVFLRGVPVAFEDHADGRDYEVTLTPVRDRSGTIVVIAVHAHEITEARARLNQAAVLWKDGPVSLLLLNLEGLAAWQAAHPSPPGQAETATPPLSTIAVEDANPLALALLGAASLDALRASLGGMDPAGAAALTTGACRLLEAPSRPVELDLVLTLPGARSIHATARLAALPAQPGGPLRAYLGLIDRTDGVSARDDIIATSTLERKRVGEDVERAFAPTLDRAGEAVLALQAALPAEVGSPLADAVRDLAKLVENARAQVRRVTLGLTRHDGAEVGLPAAMGRLADECRELWGVTCRCNLRAAALVRDRAIGMHLVAVAREAVDAAVRRGAREIGITLSASAGDGTLAIRDDGSPIAEQQQDDVAPMLMRLHAEVIRGTLSAERDGRGATTLTCRFPCV